MNRFFYLLKPIIPRRAQLFLRRLLVKKQLKQYKDVWPIFPGSQTKPKNWVGWPDGKSFAFVLSLFLANNLSGFLVVSINSIFNP